MVGHEEGLHVEKHDNGHEGGPPHAGKKNPNKAEGDEEERAGQLCHHHRHTLVQRGDGIIFLKVLSSAMTKKEAGVRKREEGRTNSKVRPHEVARAVCPSNRQQPLQGSPTLKVVGS